MKQIPWDHVAHALKDPITGVTEAFLADPSPNKINLGTKFMLQLVQKMVEESVKLVYGKDSSVVKEGRFAGVQALSGTGACCLFAEFKRRFHHESCIYMPDPTWSKYVMFLPKSIVQNAPDGSFFLLHPCAHNPTGVDPTEEQWREISYQFKIKNHSLFFDMAYQGFTSGDLDKHAHAIWIFLENEHLIVCAQSFAKNMGLYGHRVGCFSILCANSKKVAAIQSQLQQITRAMYISPLVHGVLPISTILSELDMKSLWIEEVKIMTNRIRRMKTALLRSLEKLGSPLNWEHITNQLGINDGVVFSLS